jgi:hypothetical protein
MVYKIDKQIVGYKVIKPDDVKPDDVKPDDVKPELMHENLQRPAVLTGKTYKIKPPDSEHAIYITINDMDVGGTYYPYEVFINSKNMDSFQWVLAITRLISATWRKGGNTDFLVDEMKAVFSPAGGYWYGKRFYNSLISHIGHVIEEHLGLGKVLSVEQKEFIKSKGIDTSVGYPDHATVCSKCGEKAVVVLDNCSTCLSCLDSRCG